jgi:hypothetical protein
MARGLKVLQFFPRPVTGSASRAMFLLIYQLFGSNSQDRAQGVNHLAGKVKVQMPNFRDACVQSAS